MMTTLRSSVSRRLFVGALLAVSATVVTACSDDTVTAPATTDVRVALASAGTVARPGTSVSYSLINNTDRNFEFNVCTDARLERENNGAWTEADPPRSVCNAIIQLLVPNGRLNAAYSLPANLVAGRFRITITMRNGSSPNLVISSEPFTVAP
ncbi:MAG: hypothetical protein MUF00_14015 [Gemmatimonadaceae bacterium]|jgi:hypothetical protein|nr:hypothetical protein [Gemmatimonadaceae bacterium]